MHTWRSVVPYLHDFNDDTVVVFVCLPCLLQEEVAGDVHDFRIESEVGYLLGHWGCCAKSLPEHRMDFDFATWRCFSPSGEPLKLWADKQNKFTIHSSWGP